MDKQSDRKTVKPLQPAFVSAAGVIGGALVFGASYFLFSRGSYPSSLSLIMSISFASIAEVSLSNLSYVKALRSTKSRLFLPEINDIEGTVTKDIGSKRRKGGEVSFEYEGSAAVCHAITEGDEAISAGSRVRIVCADNDSTVIVEKI